MISSRWNKAAAPRLSTLWSSRLLFARSIREAFLARSHGAFPDQPIGQWRERDAIFSTPDMAEDKLGAEFLDPLFRFAWALTGDEAGATALTHKVVDDGSWRFPGAAGFRGTEVALFSAAYRLFTSGMPLPIPPPHERVANMSKLSLRHAGSLTSDSLLKSFRELELPQRAALVLFYTTQCSLHDIAAILQRTSDETVAILSRGKAEWRHILERSGTSEDEAPEGDAR